MAKNEIMVTAIENGTVIDHIPTEKTYEVASLLHLQALTTPVTIGCNYRSKKIGRKGIIRCYDGLLLHHLIILDDVEHHVRIKDGET